MKLAVSNLAWTNEEEVEAAKELAGLGVRYIELTPTKKWPDLSRVPAAEARAYRQFWEEQGFEVAALQAILFGKPDLTLFETEAIRAKTLDYLEGTFRLAAELGAKVLVFGSPKNRRRGDLDPQQAMATAVGFFAEAGRRAEAHGVVLCIEPNAPQYSCDFVTTAAEGHELVARVNSPGFGLHLDSGCMTMAKDDPANVAKYPPRHFHISAPFLGPVEPGAADYEASAEALRGIPYQGLVSIEMKPEAGGNIERTVAAVKFSQTVFDR